MFEGRFNMLKAAVTYIREVQAPELLRAFKTWAIVYRT